MCSDLEWSKEDVVVARVIQSVVAVCMNSTLWPIKYSLLLNSRERSVGGSRFSWRLMLVVTCN